MTLGTITPIDIDKIRGETVKAIFRDYQPPFESIYIYFKSGNLFRIESLHGEALLRKEDRYTKQKLDEVITKLSNTTKLYIQGVEDLK